MQVENSVFLLEKVCRVLSSPAERATALYGFAESINAKPSYEIPVLDSNSETIQFHLAVEQELTSCAVFSFVNSPRRVAELSNSAIRSILSVSYNNVIDRHIVFSASDFKVLHNRAALAKRELHFANVDTKNLESIGFENLNKVGLAKRDIAFESCDDALISVIQLWKRLLSADYPQLDLATLSSFFNLIIFLRTIEDTKPSLSHGSEVLKHLASQPFENARNFIDQFSQMTEQQVPELLLDDKALNVIEVVGSRTFQRLVKDFYSKENVPYTFDFRLLSLRAMSKIYERYVALFKEPSRSEGQLHFINPISEEKSGKKSGSVYTPSYIASFFARYCLSNITPAFAERAILMDPACGSGVFLRAYLEELLAKKSPSPVALNAIFARVRGIDVDTNAVNAAKLSLSLLQFQYTSYSSFEFSENLRVADAILDSNDQDIPVDIVVSNPPFRKYDLLSSDEREILRKHLGPMAAGRFDLYLAFVKLAIDWTKPGGLICLVLPDAFLSSSAAVHLRGQFLAQTQIRCVIDLSLVDVFEGVGVYPILIIAQKLPSERRSELRENFLFMRCRAFAGRALEACLSGSEIETEAYSVTRLPHSALDGSTWILGSRDEIDLRARLKNFPALSEVLTVSQGFITGDDEVFLRSIEDVPANERKIYLKYLSDKQISKFRLSGKVKSYVFYPFIDGHPVDENQLQSEFPNTWAHLKKFENRLRSRRSTKTGYTPWWRPAWPRSPKVMLRPKIVTPHLSLSPRFGIDIRGEIATSHSPILTAKVDADELTILKVFCVILNSHIGYWSLTAEIRKYNRGYKKIEVSDLRNFRFPKLALEPASVKTLVELFERASKSDDETVLDDIDNYVSNLFGLSSAELRTIGIT